MTAASISPACAPEPVVVEELDPCVPREALPPPDVFARALAELMPRLLAIPTDRVRHFTAEPELAYVNAKAGYAAIEAHFDKVRRMPFVDIAIIEVVPQAALSLLGAVHSLGLILAPESKLPEMLLRGRKVRAALLHIAQGAVGLDLIPEPTVKRIMAGKGALDSARDLIDLSNLFRQYEPTLRGRLEVAPKFLHEASEVGTWLRDAMQPTKAPAKPKATPVDIKEATDLRNRAFTLLADGYAELQRVAAFLGVDVPSLQSRRPLKKKEKAKE